MISQYEKELNAVIKDLAYKKRCCIGYFEISAASSESVSIRYSLCIAKLIFLPHKSFFEKNWHQYHFDVISHFSTVSYLFIQWCPLVFQKKRVFEFLDAPARQCFEKLVAPKFFGNFPVKHPWYSPFKQTGRPSWEVEGSWLKAVVCRPAIC